MQFSRASFSLCLGSILDKFEQCSDRIQEVLSQYSCRIQSVFIQYYDCVQVDFRLFSGNIREYLGCLQANQAVIRQYSGNIHAVLRQNSGGGHPVLGQYLDSIRAVFRLY
jgi:hypothetical protein